MIFDKQCLFIFKEDLINPQQEVRDFLSEVKHNDNLMDYFNKSENVFFVDVQNRMVKVLLNKKPLKYKEAKF